MANGITISKLEGVGGEVWIGKSARAAGLVSWIAVPREGGMWEFSGRLSDSDAYLLTQGPDAVRLPLGQGHMRWSGTLEIQGDSVRAMFVGPPEAR
ncbi:MAG: hypothetical protein AB7R67_21850 [Vicinamibacterales bacterium]